MMIILVAVILVLAVLLLNKAYKRTNDYKNLCLDIRDFACTLQKQYSMANLGSTYAKYAFGGCKELGLNECDLSLQHESFNMDYAILRSFSKQIKKAGVVFIPVAACAPIYKGDGDNLLYYEVLKKHEIIHYNLKYKLEQLFPLLLHPKRLKKLIKDVQLLKSIYDRAPVIASTAQSEKQLSDLENVWKKLFHLEALDAKYLTKGHYEVLQDNIVVLEKIVSYCQDNEFQPILVVPPFSERLNRAFSRSFMEEVIERPLKTISEKMNIPYLNYQEDLQFQKAFDLFVDGGFCLNQRGSMVFVKRLAKDFLKYNVNISNETMGVHEKC